MHRRVTGRRSRASCTTQDLRRRRRRARCTARLTKSTGPIEPGGRAEPRAPDPRGGAAAMASPFQSPKEFREVMDQVFAMMSEDPEMGPRLRDADVPQRFEFEDVDLVMNIRAGQADEDANLHWEWTDEVDWQPRVRMTMSSETANRYFQGKENVALAIA